MKSSHPQTRKDKLICLQEFLNLETGQVDESKFDYENDLYTKAVSKKALDAEIRSCALCPGLNIKRFTEDCPGWGDLNAKIFFIGQSLHQPGISTDLPFILGSGYILDVALRLSGLLRKDVFITNVVHCHPPRNRASSLKEKKNCLQYLITELVIVKPRLIVALGNDAEWAVSTIIRTNSNAKSKNRRDYIEKCKTLKLKHPASFVYSAPEERIGWILRLSKEIDKIYADEEAACTLELSYEK